MCLDIGDVLRHSERWPSSSAIGQDGQMGAAMKYEIGQQVYHATWDTRTAHVVCPDCGGTGRLRVTFHDDTQVSIDCRNCSSGYDKPSGQVQIYERQARANLSTITGCEVDGTKVEWRLDTHYRVSEDELFDLYVPCLEYAKAKAAAADKAELEKVNTKQKDTRTWAWNASYHRKCIKDAQKALDYHTAKLNVAALKAKEPT
jgi:hypothetical protein